VTVSGMVSARSIVWNSSNTAVATINANGIASALSPGTSTITPHQTPSAGTPH
jgi:hypothetical protein